VESESETVRETDKTLFTLDLHLTLQTFCIIANAHASDQRIVQFMAMTSLSHASSSRQNARMNVGLYV